MDYISETCSVSASYWCPGRAVDAFPAAVYLNSSPGLPDPFAVATVNGEQTKTTAVSKRTLNPYWNESFDLYV